MRYYRVLILSLIIHLLLVGLISLLPRSEATRPDLGKTSFVELMEKPELAKRPHQPPKDEKQFVRSVNVPETLLAKAKKRARFSSQEDISVLQEQRARLNDLSVNRSSDGNTLPAREQKTNEQQKLGKLKTHGKGKDRYDFNPDSMRTHPPDSKLLETLFDNGAANPDDVQIDKRPERKTAGESGDPLLFSAKGFEHGISTFGESAPDDVRFGDFTSLNTDRNIFYSFYARMEEKIRGRWVDHARAVMYALPADPRKMTGRETWSTKLEIVLDREGRFLKAILHESSGIQGLDSAPVMAFKEAYQFPNPPQEMVKDDGTIRIYYAFNVYQ